MSEVTLDALPAGESWWADFDRVLEPTFCLSGTGAGQMAATVALWVTATDRDVHLFVQDRQDQTIARPRCFAV